MSAAGKNFHPVVKSCHTRIQHNLEFFTCAQSTNTRHWVKIWNVFFKVFPGHFRIFSLIPFQPDIVRQGGLAIYISIQQGFLVLIIPLLKICRQAPRQTEKLKQSIIKVFKDCGLNITIEVGLTRVIFLDVVMDLEKDVYKPYRKPGDKPLYVSSWSNHPPLVIKNIPLGINKRLCEISSSKEVFLEAIP